MKRKVWICLLTAFLIVLLAMGAFFWLRGRDQGEIDETVNLIKNGSFETIDAGEPEDWVKGQWFWDTGVSALELSSDAYTGEHSIMVYNASENDARFTQTIAVVPGAHYRIRCMVKAEGCDVGRNGAGLSVENTFVSSEYAYDTQGEWVELTLYGTTGPKQTSMTVMARLGGYGSLNVGRAWFDDIEVTRLKSLPQGVRTVSFATNPPSTSNQAEDDSGKVGSSIILCALWAVFVTVMGADFMRRKASDSTTRLVLWVGVAIAMLARVICATHIRGYEVDMNCFEGWASRMAEYGPLGFYNAGWCDYPPGYMLVLYVLGGLRNLFGWTADGPLVWLLIKSVPILCDALTAWLLYRMSEKKLGQWPAAIIALIYLFNPATVLNSAAWGQVDSVLTLLLVLSLYLVARYGSWTRAIVVYACAVLIKPQALMFGPIGLMAAVCEIVRASGNASERRKVLIDIGRGVGLAFVLMLAVLTPFAVGQGQNPFSWACTLYGNTLSSYPYITINACNLYTMLGMNWRGLAESGWAQYLAWSVYALSFLYAFFLYIRSGKRSSIFMSCAVMLTLVFAFGAKMHERYLYPAIALLLACIVVHGDVRLWISLGLISVGQFFNGALVLQNEHLQSSQAIYNNLAALMNIAGALLTAWIGWDVCVRKRTMTLEEITPRAGVVDAEMSIWQKPVRENACLHLKRVDYVMMAVITLLYSVLAFINLGTMKAPQTTWTSSLQGESVIFNLGDVKTFHMTYFGGICNTSFTVSFSEDGANWSDEEQAIYDQGEIFRWLWFTPAERNDKGDFNKLESGYPMDTARYVRITAERAGLILNEIAFLDEDGNVLPIESVSSMGGDAEYAGDPKNLVDEQDTVPAHPSYYNSTYFDEIYHARTAYEHLHGMRPYEYTHPPLGKVLIMLGIYIFGMTPFGWRFMGTLFGCLMLPVMYLLVKQLLKRTEFATLATFLMAVDCMHFTQTRIATIDTYGVFFILLMYLFMLRYCQMSFYFDSFKRTLIPLGLCGLAMGLGIASKWICIYAAVGLAVLLFITLGRRYMEYRAAMKSGGKSAAEECARKNFWKYFWMTGAFCVVFFIVIPLVIYYLSYYWFMKPMGGLSIKGVWEEQLRMFNYHKGLTNDTHYFRSPWYEWPLIVKPMWYYSGADFMPADMVSSISCMGNPAVWWTGLAALIFVIVRLVMQAVRHEKIDRSCLFVVIGFASQYVPWMLVPRSMFIYHYFASVPFIIMAIALVQRWLKGKIGGKGYRAVVISLAAAALILFIGFYPLMSGMPVARSYAMYLRWFNWYNF